MMCMMRNAHFLSYTYNMCRCAVARCCAPEKTRVELRNGKNIALLRLLRNHMLMRAKGCGGTGFWHGGTKKEGGKFSGRKIEGRGRRRETGD